MWKVLKTKFRIETPFHIGFQRVGIINQTRYYVPGKNFWGALTAKLTPILGTNYKELGDFLKTHVIFTYHYLENEKNGLLKPSYREKEGLFYGNKYAYEFEEKFVTSFTSTAINEANLAAENETLHEYEFVLDRDKANNKMYLVGNLFIKENESDKFQLKIKNNKVFFNNICLDDFLKEIGLNIGGERRLGSGLIKLQSLDLENENTYIINDDKIIRKFKTNQTLDSHLIVSASLNIRGEVEAVLGKEHGSKGPGQKTTKGVLAWVPGSIIREDLDLELEVDITRFGMYKLANAN